VIWFSERASNWLFFCTFDSLFDLQEQFQQGFSPRLWITLMNKEQIAQMVRIAPGMLSIRIFTIGR